MTSPHKQVLILTGATAVGKTALAIQWATQFDGEIINADSRQIYRHMDIGTAKPSLEEQATAPHHLIDIVNPDETLTASEYIQQANAAIQDIQSRGKLPIFCGGTGMYITATMEGWRIPQVPPNEELRAELEPLPAEELFARYQQIDPEGAEQIDRHNPRRLVRALEVCIVSGQPFSELRRKQPPDYDGLYFALTMDRELLYERADTRMTMMLERGWIDEVKNLATLGYSGKLPAMSALGYREIADFVRGDLSMEDTITQIKRDTRQFIRRQYTWMRGHEPPQGWHWIESESDIEHATQTIESWLAVRAD